MSFESDALENCVLPLARNAITDTARGGLRSVLIEIGHSAGVVDLLVDEMLRVEVALFEALAQQYAHDELRRLTD